MVHDGLAEVAYVFDPEAWARGLGREATAWLMDYCTRVHGVKRFFATAHPENARSLALCRRLDFRPVGTWPRLLSYDEGDVVMVRDA
jgi:RimJ/RimL family protein N-acetyltransferase